MSRVLVVDDSPTMRQLMAYALSQLPDCEVETAEDGLEGFKKLVRSPFDVIVTTLHMPVMDGHKLLRLVRGDPDHARVKVVVVTAAGDEEAQKLAFDSGASAVINKPLQAPEIVAVVRGLLGEEE